jgi:hypothetical protein
MNEDELNMVTQLREKIKDLEFELKDLREQMVNKNTLIGDLIGEIWRLRQKLPPDRGAKT